jgi:hypothetical protein
MTPKEQAKELVENFGDLIHTNDEYYSQKEMIKKHNEDSKECAYLAVNYIILVGYLWDESEYTDSYYQRSLYWNKVKEEIEKL